MRIALRNMLTLVFSLVCLYFRSAETFNDFADAILLCLDRSMPFEVHSMTLVSLVPTFYRYFFNSLIEHPDSNLNTVKYLNSVVVVLRQQAAKIYDWISYQLIADYFPLRVSCMSVFQHFFLQLFI